MKMKHIQVLGVLFDLPKFQVLRIKGTQDINMIIDFCDHFLDIKGGTLS